MLMKFRWILHGDADSVVYLRATNTFIDLVNKNLPEVEVRLDVAPGKDHAFDIVEKD